MLHNEARELLVKAYEKTGNAREVAECFGVDRRKLRTNKRGRKPSLSSEDLFHIDKAIQQQPDITIDEIIEKLDLTVTNETVRKAVIKMGYVYKKKSLYASERERPRCERKKEKLD